jgi:molecular chaperone GrpE
MTGTDPGAGASNPGVTSPQASAPVAGQELPDPYGMLAQTLADRRTLVQLCLYALDRARSDGVAERIERGLAGVGVAPVRPDGLPFDPALHEAAGTVPTQDAGLDGLIAETEVVGFTDHGRVLRVPVVTVYQLAGGT